MERCAFKRIFAVEIWGVAWANVSGETGPYLQTLSYNSAPWRLLIGPISYQQEGLSHFSLQVSHVTLPAILGPDNNAPYKINTLSTTKLPNLDLNTDLHLTWTYPTNEEPNSKFSIATIVLWNVPSPYT